jgi:hypothetical protein
MIRVTNQREFDISLKKIAKKIEVDAGTLVRKVAFDLFNGVVSRTPVDTGWARSSWNIAFRTPDLSVPPKPASGGESAAIAANNAQEAKLDQIKAGDFPTVWITNALDYIEYLEAGHSKQAGKGFMVQRTLAETRADVNRALKALG